jgi:hypothetical protein
MGLGLVRVNAELNFGEMVRHSLADGVHGCDDYDVSQKEQITVLA